MKKAITYCLILSTLMALPALAKSKGTLTGKVNINEATVEQLAMLPGVGASTAKAIAEYRQKNKFNTVEDLKNIPGIGEKTLAKLVAYVVLTGPTTAQWIKTPNVAKADKVSTR